MARLSNEEREEILLTLIDRMDDSIKDLQEIDRLDDAGYIEDLLASLNSELVEVNEALARERMQEQQEAIRDYYRSVM